MEGIDSVAMLQCMELQPTARATGMDDRSTDGASTLCWDGTHAISESAAFAIILSCNLDPDRSPASHESVQR